MNISSNTHLNRKLDANLLFNNILFSTQIPFIKSSHLSIVKNEHKYFALVIKTAHKCDDSNLINYKR